MVQPLLRPQSLKELSGLTVIIPCYKEDEEFLTKTYHTLINKGAEVLIVDDGGDMSLEVPHISYKPNMGYGYAIKQGIDKSSNPLICTMDGDGQHTVEDVCKIYRVFNMITNCSMVVGSRWNLKEPSYRWLGRKVLNFLASCIARHYLVDLNSGMRIFKKDLALAYHSILCDTFSFTTSITMSFVTDGYKTAYFPIDVMNRIKGKSRVSVIKDGFVMLFYILWIGLALRTRRIRAWKRKFLSQEPRVS